MHDSLISLHELGALLWRRRWLIGTVFAVGVSTVLVLAWLQAPVYRATAKLMVTSSRATITVSPDANERPRVEPVTEADLGSEVAMLSSRGLLKEVLEPHRDDKPQAGDTPRGLAALATALGELVNLPGALYRSIHGLAPDSALDAWVEDAAHHLTVSGVGRSNLIEVSYEDGDPAWAATLVNDVVSHHVERHVRMNRETSAQQFYGEQRELLAAKLRDAETALRAFYAREGIANEGTGLAAQRARVQQLEVALHDAQTGLAESTAEADYLARALTEMPRGSAIAVGHGASGDLLQSRLTELELQRNQLLSQYAPTSVKVADIDSQIAQARRMLAAPGARGVTSSDPTQLTLQASLTTARARAAALQARAAALQTQLDAGRSELQHLDAVGIEQDGLEQGVAAAKQTLATYLKKEEEARFSNALDESRIVNVAIVEPAALPETPQPSKRLLMLAVGALLSLAAGLALAVVRDRLDPRVQAASDAQRISQLPVLAEIPS